jgi:membrane-associated phospholipid phosphatase
MRILLLALALLGPIESLDAWVRDAVQRGRTPELEGTMRGASGIGKPAVIFGGLLAIAIFDAAAGPATARLALAALAPTNLLVEGLKRATFRTRPDGERKRSNASFPSSHAANAFALAAVLARRWKRATGWLYAGAALVAFSRIYLDRHWASDVLVGAALGLACAAAAIRWLSAWAERRGAKAAEPAPGSARDGGPRL